MLIVPVLALLAPAAMAQETPGFDVLTPTAFAFTPDGRLLIATRAGTVEVFREGTAGTVTALDISAKICTNGERGLVGLAVDPQFVRTGFVYLYYTFRKEGNCAIDRGKLPVNRLSRFVLGADDTIARSSERVLVDNIPSLHGNHNAGDLHFGRDGFLYVSVGDSACALDDPSRCQGENDNARQSHLLTGKILRITRDGAIPRDNPYRETGDRCGATGRTSPGRRCQETFASGLRNPFRFAMDPNAAGTRFFINDVGWGTWEEIDEGRAGADYGRSVREGFCAAGTDAPANCTDGPARYADPVFAYHHGECSSITGAAFVPNGVWPAAYDGDYLYGDYVCGKIFRLSRDGDGDWQSSPFATIADGRGGPISLGFGPAGEGQALYYTTFTNGGQLRRIAFTGDDNRAPRAAVAAAPTAGPAPLLVAFDGQESWDPEGGTLTYDWDFGDGSAPATGPRPEHTYREVGLYTARLTVTDPAGATDTATIEIDVGDRLPRPVIDAPTASTRFAVGDEITLTGHAVDAAGDALPAADYDLSWEVLLHHNTHTHPFLQESGTNVTFRPPPPEDLSAAANSFLEIRLTAANDAGSRTVAQDFRPNAVDLHFDTDPPVLELRINGQTFTGATTLTSWEGWGLRVEAPPQSADGQTVEWAAWSDGAPRAARSLTTPGTAPEEPYTASFRAVTLVAPEADARVAQARPDANFGRATQLRVAGGRTERFESFLRFEVEGVTGTIERATLRLYVPDMPGAGTADGPALFATGNRWSEAGITWERRPERQGAVLDNVGAIAAGGWVEYDVTALVDGDGTYSVVLASNVADDVVFAARESGQAPQLVIVVST